jgi:hypothetical protein
MLPCLAARLAPLALLTLLPACSHHRYRLELEPRGEALHRELSYWRIFDESNTSGRAFPAEDRARLATSYAEVDVEQGVASGDFAGALPAELGGHGRYLRFPSEAGTAVVYVERVRGTLDVWAEVQRIERLAEEVAGMARGWLESELGSDPRWPALAEFLDGPFRRDLLNSALLLRFPGLMLDSAGEDDPNSFTSRLIVAGQFLAEQDYLRWEDLPLLTEAIDPKGDDEGIGYDLLQRAVARRMGVADEEPLPESLAFLAAEEALEASIARWYAESDLAARGIESDEIGNAVGELVDFPLFEPVLDLHVELRGVPAPLLTNGAWDATAGAVRWPAARIDEGRSPRLCYAFWFELDPAWQRAHPEDERTHEALFEAALRANAR